MIVDDEQLARERIRSLLEREPDVSVVAECPNGPSALETLRNRDVDLLFLDVQMPEMDAFELIRALPPERCPTVIFVTAYDRYALRAFDVHAFDYLLKPVDSRRLRETLDRVVKLSEMKKRSSELHRHLQEMLAEYQSGRAQKGRLALKSDGEILLLKPEEIDWVESAGNYVCLHIGSKTRLLRETLHAMEDRLSGHNFLRIHRSALVNIAKIRSLKPMLSGDYSLEMQDGTKLTLSRTHRERVLEKLCSR